MSTLDLGLLREILTTVWFEPFPQQPYTFFAVAKGDGYLLGARYQEADVHTGEMCRQVTRKWYISPHATKSEIIQTALKLCLTSMEHRTREHFRYKNVAVFGPHFDVDKVYDLCSTEISVHLDLREQQP
jgi:hypothetical protein